MATFQTITPIDGSVYLEKPYHTPEEVEATLIAAEVAQKAWVALPLEERKRYIRTFIDVIVSQKEAIAEEISRQMGRPLSQSGFEVNGFQERAEYLLKIADASLEAYCPEEMEGFERCIEKEPLGIVAILSPWNYPFLTSVNVLIPALLAGNAVILKHSLQTPLVAERYKSALEEAGLPEGVFSVLHIDHPETAVMLADERIAGVFFTGSVEGGHAVQEAVANKFIPCGLELGGKDPAYVRPDANLESTVPNLVDGSFFNSGQSCCGVERIYVHEEVYDAFVEQFAEETRRYKLGSPLDAETTIGPMVKTSASDFVRGQIKEAVAAGATPLIDESLFPASKEGTPYLAPQVLVDVDHSMSVMQEESFGPVVGIMKVSGDAEAIELMNDSEYGLTASLWTRDKDRARELSRQIETGTVYMNRCDYLDPALAWTGVKNTGRGVSLSPFVYDSVTRLKSIHFRLEE
jgi:acyl-CoA reductase-like NAD-dependent aldehyde dehydrogenase